MFRLYFTLLLAAVLLAGAGCAAAAAKDSVPAIGDKAQDFELMTLDHKPVKLSKLTETGPAVIVVLRGYPGYQCPVCNQQVGSLVAKADEFKKAGAQLVLIYPGEAEKLDAFAKEFVGKMALPDNVMFVTDPGYKFTNAYGLRWDAKNETAYPSTFVVDKNRQIKYALVSKSHVGRAKTDEVLKAVKGIGG